MLSLWLIINDMNVKRQIVEQVLYLKEKFPILAVTGPRQSGKTTMLRNLFPEYKYISLENPDIRLFAEQDPKSFFETYAEKVIFDEVQQVPKLFSYMQSIVDDSGQMGQFILSGSQNFHLMANITQSLAGRVAIFKLLPFDFKELESAGLLSDDYAVNMTKGFYPAIYDRDISARVYYDNYIQTYIERDISAILNIKDMKSFRNFIGLCAARAGQVLNISSLANECDISQPTAKSWITVLETSFIVYLLQPYYKNYSKRIVKSPKLYFYDSGLLSHILRMTDPVKVKINPKKGHIFENMIVSEYIKQSYHRGLQNDFFYWRDSAGHEIDLIRISDEGLEIIEIKATETIMPDLFKGLSYFEKIAEGEDISRKTLLYAGKENQKRSVANVLSWRNIT